MTSTKENWGFLVASVIKSQCPKCDAKYKEFGYCTRTCAIELKLVQPNQKCLRDYWEGDQDEYNICDSCGEQSSVLTSIKGLWVCDDCRSKVISTCPECGDERPASHYGPCKKCGYGRTHHERTDND